MRVEQWIYTVPLRLRSLFRRRGVEEDLEAELEFHLERETQERVARGSAMDQARRGALLAFEGVERCKEECRDSRRTTWLDNLVRDFLYAGRTLRKAPGFSATAVLTLALGIGAGTAIFSVANAVLLRPLPYRAADRLVLVPWESQPGNRNFLYSNADFFDLRAGTAPVFDELGGVSSFRAFVPREDGSAEQVSKALVTTNFFRLMGARVAVGRDFTEADAIPQPSAAEVLIPPGAAAILSYEYWQRRYGGRAAALGQEMPSSGQRGPRIVGVLEPGFKLLFPPGARVDAAPDFWVANNIGYDTAHRNLMTVGAIGRLKSGLTLAAAQQQLDALAPEARKNSFMPVSPLRLECLHRTLVQAVRPAIVALMGAVVLLLLIACGNVASLFLVRASLRERELAVRAALGGSRWRLICQTLAEATLIAGPATLLGIALAWLGIRALLAIAPENLPRIEATSIDWRVLAFAASAGLLAAALSGVFPALRAAAPEVNQVLCHTERTPGLAAGGRLRKLVVIAEVALSFVLLIGSGLLFRSFLELRRIDPGYDPAGVLTLFATRDWPLPRQEGRLELLRSIQERLRAVPGVQSVTAALVLPLGGGQQPKHAAKAARHYEPASTDGADFQQVLPGYFETLRTPVLAGRVFTGDDYMPGRNLVVIDDLLAARAYPGQSPVGKRIRLPDPRTPWAQVIGVVAHQRLATLSERGSGTVYFSDGFWGIGVSRYWILRTEGHPEQYAKAVRAAIASVDQQVVVTKLQPMQALVDRDQAGIRLSLLLMGSFAAVALLLAAVGIYGVLAGMVRQRTAEIGVGIALGATPASIFQLIAGHGMRLSAIGVAIGLAAAVAVSRGLDAMLVGVGATDPSTFLVVTILFLLIGLVASWAPAAHAARLDPNTALRDE